MVNWLEILNRSIQLFSSDSIGKGINFLINTFFPNMSLWPIIWFLFAILISGFLLLILLDQSIGHEIYYDFLESICLAGALGFCFIAQIGHILDILYEVSISSITTVIVLLCVITLLMKKNAIQLFLRGQTIQKRHVLQLLAVIAVGTFIRLYDNAPDQIINRLSMPYKDPSAHFLWGQVVSDSGHALSSPLTPGLYPNGFGYIVGTIFLPQDAIQNYYLAWLFIPFIIVVFSTLSVYIVSLKLNQSGTAALFSSLIFNTSWIILQRTRALLSDNFGFILVPLLFVLMLDRKRRKVFVFLYGSLFVVNPVPAIWVTVSFIIYGVVILIIKFYNERNISVVLSLIWAALPSILLILLFALPQWGRALPFFITIPSNGDDGVNGNLPSIDPDFTPISSIKFRRIDWYYLRDTGPITVGLAVLGATISLFRKSDKRLSIVICMFVVTLIMAHFHIVIFQFIHGHEPKRILMYNLLAISVLASTGLLKVKEYLRTFIQSKKFYPKLSGKALRIFILIVLLQQLAVGVINTGTYYYSNDFRDDEMRALFWLEQNTETDVTIVEYHDHQVGRLDVSWFLYPRHVLKDGFIGFYHLTTPEEILIWVETHQIDYVLLRIENMPDFYLQFHEIINQMSEFEMVFQDGAILVYQFNK